MPLNIPDHAEVFVDANIFVYHFSGPTEYTDHCTRFLQRLEQAQLVGFTSALVLAETLHRLMVIEATVKLQLDPKQAIRHLKSHPAAVKKLNEHLAVPDKIQALGVNVLPCEVEDIRNSGSLKREYGLLTNDAINLAVMRRRQLSHIATNDPDFERVSNLTVWRPV